MANTIEVETVLAIDIGSITTRAILFDAASERYRFLAMGTATSTLGAPLYDAGRGVRQAIDQLQAVTGRVFLNFDNRLISPSSIGEGVDRVAVTVSGGKPLKIIAIGLLEDISLAAAKKLATSTYAYVADGIEMNDGRSMEKRLDAILGHHPDLIVVAGGTDQGAGKSVLRMLEPLKLANRMLPENLRAKILFAGNQGISAQVKRYLEEVDSLYITENVRPALDVEQLGPAQGAIQEIFRDFHTQTDPSLQEIDGWANGRLMPSATGFGRVVKFLSRFYDSGKGVLGVDLGANSTTISAALDGELRNNVYTQLGVGEPLTGILKFTSPEKIAQWLPIDIPKEEILNFVHHKSVYPASLPTTQEELYLEQAVAREVLRIALRRARRNLPGYLKHGQSRVLPAFEPILVSGSAITKAPRKGQSLLTILDALEPTGITTIVLDQNNIVRSLGAAAEVNPAMVVQVLDSGALLNLGTVISPMGNSRFGTPVVRIKVKTDGENEQTITVKQGSLEVIPLSFGRVAQLHLQPLHRYDVGMGGPGKGGNMRVTAGAAGVIIDARGRPLNITSDPGRRKELIKKWLWKLG